MRELQFCGHVTFPEPADVSVNMMPVIPGDPSTNPFPQYQGMIWRCSYDADRVWYLTINESLVRAGSSQRRGGVHIEAPGPGRFGGGSPGGGHGGGWGGGSSSGGLRDGIYMASNVAGSCRAWNVRVEDRDPHGGCERPEGQGVLLGAGELWWMTDHCPHEALPVDADTYRQFFRLIAPDVSLWYAQHNTPNPLGLEPGCPVTHESKFEVVGEAVAP